MLSTSNARSGALREADWLIVDEEAETEAMRVASSFPRLGILSLDGRGSRARVLAPRARVSQQSLSEVPTLSQLFELLSQEAPQPEQPR
jgi:hypothetical protein